MQNKSYINGFDEEKTRQIFATVSEYYHQKDDQKSKPQDIDSVDVIRELPPTVTEVSDRMIDMVNKAKRKVRIIQPYIQNVPEFEDALEDAMKRNVDIEIISARKRDQPIYSALLNADLFKRLLKAGAKVYEEPYKFLHMKALSVDDEYLTMGSFNQDNTSFYCNNEANLVIKNELNAKESSLYTFDDIFNNLREECIEVSLDEKYTWFGGFKAFFWKRMLDIHLIVMRNR